MSDSRERSAAEREQARLEREQARLELERGRSGGEPAPPPEAPLPPAQTPAARSEPADPDVEPPQSQYDELDDGHPADEYDGHQDDGFDDEYTDEHEIPVGTLRVERRKRLERAGPAAAPSRRPVRRPRRRRSLAVRVVSLLALVLAGAAIWFLYELFQPFHGSGRGGVEVTIPAHASTSQIGDLLERDGVISSSFFFKLRAGLAGDRSDLRSGTYHLKLGMGYGDVLTALTTPPKAAPVSKLTIIEGKTRKEVDALLRSQHVRGSYLAATRHSKLLNPRGYGAPRSTSTLEGFLFPSTFQLRDPISIDALVTDQLKTFKKEFRSVNLASAKRKHLTAFDVLTIASMVQAEAETARDRPLIASVIYNRLRDGMPLQIDATTRFATGNYAHSLTVSQLNSSSPYNTRIHKGLPPGPIDSPGLASIQAAAHPSHTDYLYFVVKPCGNGEHVFASSYAPFLRSAARYQTARSQRGGKSPAQC